jgi:hypothetical protein
MSVRTYSDLPLSAFTMKHLTEVEALNTEELTRVEDPNSVYSVTWNNKAGAENVSYLEGDTDMGFWYLEGDYPCLPRKLFLDHEALCELYENIA